MLSREGFRVTAIARQFAPSQKFLPPYLVIERSFAALNAAELSEMIESNNIDIVVNCVGVLQDGPRGRTEDVHCGFAERLVKCINSCANQVLLIHLSVPDDGAGDPTPFSRTKRVAEETIRSQCNQFVILRPGFVIAPVAYGGSALLRALAMLPMKLSRSVGGRPLAVTDCADIARTIATVARRWRRGERGWKATWNVMTRDVPTVEGVVEVFRLRLGGPAPRLRIPSPILTLGAVTADLISHLGWSPPIRSTALREMRRGVSGDPAPWIAAVGFEPPSLTAIAARMSATVQEKWFARLYLVKALVLATVVAFWLASGLIPLLVSYDAAASMLVLHGFSKIVADWITTVCDLMDIAIGVAIAYRRSCRLGLFAGIGLSAIYIVAATILAPSLWIDPLGALVKIVPALVLMFVALTILDDR